MVMVVVVRGEAGADRSYFGSSAKLAATFPTPVPRSISTFRAASQLRARAEKQRSDRINVGAAWRFVPIAGLSFPPLIMTNCDQPGSPEMPSSFSTARYSDWNWPLVRVFRSRAIVSLGILS